MEDWIKEWYKHKYNESLVNTPKSAWSKIDKELNDWPSHWYKSNSNEINIKPKPNLWESINNSLPQHLAPVKISLNYFRLSVFSLFLVVLSPFLLLNPISNLNITNSDNRISLQQTKSKKSISLIDKGVAEKKAMPKNISNETDLAVNNKIVEKDYSVSEKTVKTNIIKENTIISKENKLAADFMEKDFLDLILHPKVVSLESNYLINKHKNLSIPKNTSFGNKWSFIAGAHFQRTNLITPISYRAKTDKNVSIETNFNTAFNIGLLRDLKQNSRVFGSLFIGNENVQSYNVISKNTIQHNELKIKSLSLNFGYEQKLWDIGSRSNLWYSTGVFSSYISNVEEFTNGMEQTRLSEGFRNIDFGVFSGFTFDYSINPNLILTSQVNYNIGAINIFEGVEKVPANFFQTRTSSLNLGLGIRISL